MRISAEFTPKGAAAGRSLVPTQTDASRHAGRLPSSLHCKFATRWALSATFLRCSIACTTGDPCASVKFCEAQASCTRTTEGCETTNQIVCQRSSECDLFGFCTFDGTRCAALTDADCRHNDGRAECGDAPGDTPGDGPFCVKVCASHGYCSAVGGICAATTDTMCSVSVDCVKHKKCYAIAGDCAQANEAACTSSADCKNSGRCTEAMGECWASSGKDCAASTGCKDAGLCKFVPASCPKDLPCALTPTHGTCRKN